MGGPEPHLRAGRMLWVTFAWGTCFITISIGLEHAPPLWLAAMRALVAGLVLTVVACILRTSLPRDLRTWALIVTLGLVNVGVAYASMFGAIATVSTGVASALANAQPILIVLPAWWLFHERPSGRTSAAMILGLAGLLLIAMSAGLGTGSGLALASAAAVTAGTLISRIVRAEPLVAAAAQLLIGGVLLAGAAVLVEGAPAVDWTPNLVLVVLFMAVIGTAAPTVAWFAEARRARLDALATWTLLVPVFGIALSLVLLRETPGTWGWFGMAIVVASMLLLAVRPPGGHRLHGLAVGRRSPFRMRR